MNSLISAGIILAGVASVLWGISDMHAHGGAETPASAVKIGVGGVAGIIGFVPLINFLRGMAVFRAMKSGRGVIARWHVGAAEFELFRANNARREALGPAYRNDWRLPRKIPGDGMDVIFSADAVMVGDTYFGLSSTGIFRFAGVQILPEHPLVLEFGTIATAVWEGASAIHINQSTGVLRVPIGALARDDAVRILNHFQAVDRGEVRVHSRRFIRALKGGLVVTLVCVGSAIYGWSIRESGSDLALASLVVGVVGGLGALCFSAVAGLMLIAERKGG